uniref:Uncharacterized protein LOC104220817 n=1 Tax=Nicotiana sylvestris TaxID=4096 RepID=A0A1U7VUN0_NICSY|nr:PREDICTED: uncharacterized protein LOC104220817 [Nicotiana sylvestris]
MRMLGQGHPKELLSNRGRTNFARGREQPQGPLKSPSPARTVQMIIGGGDDTNVKRIMVDDGNDMCIIHPQVLVQMRLEDKIISHCITLTGFNNVVERTYGEIVLPILAGGFTLETKFHVMNQETTYNAIIGRPWIHAM